MKTLQLLTFFVVLSSVCCAQKSESQSKTDSSQQEPMKIKITFADTELTAILYDNPTASSLAAMLPITTTLEDYANNEKIFYPDEKLTTESAPEGYEPSKGDITYFAPWGDVAIFYKDFKYSQGLISLGKIENNGIEELRKAGDAQVSFTLIKE